MATTHLLLLCFISCQISISIVNSFGYFEKDDLLNMVFPPVFKKSQIPEIPTGHLRSLGFQRISDGPIKEVTEHLDGKEFYDKYSSHNQPVTIRQCLDKQSPLMSLWTDEKLRYRHGGLNVTVVRRHKNVKIDPHHVTLNEFLDNYKLMDLYMTTPLPYELESEVLLPDFLRCGPQSRNLVEAELWMGYGGTGSLLHYHAHHQVHCVVDGREDFIFIDPLYKSNLKCVEKEHEPGEGYSTLNTEMINMYAEAQVADIPWTYTSLKSGDCALVPSGFLHHVRHLGRSLSFSIQYQTTNDNNLSDCPVTEKTKKALQDFDMIWTIKKNKVQLKNENIKPSQLKALLLQLTKTNDLLTMETFKSFYIKAVSKAGNSAATAQSVFYNLDTTKSGKITRKQLEEINVNQLEKVCRILNSVHVRKRDEL